MLEKTEKIEIQEDGNRYCAVYNKKDIMEIFKCESDKALKILKMMYQMKEANKIGREYYVTKESLENFLENYKGKSILI